MPEERYIALAEVKEYLEQESKGRDFTPEQRISYDDASKIAKLSAAKARELVDELKAISFVPEPVAVRDRRHRSDISRGRPCSFR